MQCATVKGDFGGASGAREGDSACFYVGQCFSDQPKTRACLRVREALSVSVRGEGEGACDNCMYVCVYGGKGKGGEGGGGGGSGLARWRSQGQMRGWPLSGHRQMSL